MPQRKIIHVDMDCFYAAVEVKYRPELRGKAIGIGGPPNTRSVLCTASYEARKYKVRAAMPSSLALQLCPHLILLPPNFELYKKESLALREILSRFCNLIEPLSLDEAYLDVTDSQHFRGSATLIAQEIRALVKKESGLTISAGVSTNKFLAKIASDWKKPDGLFVIRPEQIESFIKTLPIEKIYGVGQVTAQKMHELGLHFCSDIQNRTLEQLSKYFGSRGESLYQLSRGFDERAVDNSSERKSLSVEETFAKDLPTLDACLSTLPGLYQDWERRIKKAECRERIRGFVVKVKFFDFKSTTHETSSKSFPCLQDFEALLRRIWERRAAPVRLIGLGTRLIGEAPQPQRPEQLKLALF
jgi:DNA polymerase-4